MARLEGRNAQGCEARRENRGVEPASPTLYLSLTAAVSILAVAAATGFCVLASPRLASWHPAAAAALRYATAAFAAALCACITFEALSVWLGKDLVRLVPEWRRALFGALYPLCRAAGRIAGQSTGDVAASYIALSNALALRGGAEWRRGPLLVLLPRCLQREGCTQAITEEIRNCRRCGNCDIAELVALMERYGLRMAVATGGRLARAMVRELRPSGVIAIACGRELIEGLVGIRGIPVFCIPNRMPEGPCRNTRVDLGEFEATVRRLMEGEKGGRGEGVPG